MLPSHAALQALLRRESPQRLIAMVQKHPLDTAKLVAAVALFLYFGPGLWYAFTGVRSIFGGLFQLMFLAAALAAGLAIGMVLRRFKRST